MPKTDWNPLLREEFEKDYWASLMSFVAAERDRYDVFPPHAEVFAALHLTPYAAVKVVILGQDPYHGRGQAHGLCFSVRPGVDKPPSLANILVELESDLGISPPGHLDSDRAWGELRRILDAGAHDGILVTGSLWPAPGAARVTSTDPYTLVPAGSR